MKFLTIIAALIWVVHGLSDEDEWKQFKVQHGKTYRSLLDEKRRFEVFKSNRRMIENHNQQYRNGEQDFEMRINQFGDLTHEEFKQMLTLQNQHMPQRSNSVSILEDDKDLPEEVDWRKKGAVTNIKDQGSCGSCWAFSAVGAIEGQIYLKNKTLESLSAQNVLDCAGKEYGNDGCNGGWMDNAFKYVKEHGVLTEDAYPYYGRERTCSKQGGVNISGYQDIPKEDEKTLMKALATIGPVSVAIDATYLQFYFGGVITNKSGCRNNTTSLNHAVLVVGYGSGIHVKDYWIIKNSWGWLWGEKGYFRVQKDDKNTCGIASAASYPILTN